MYNWRTGDISCVDPPVQGRAKAMARLERKMEEKTKTVMAVACRWLHSTGVQSAVAVAIPADRNMAPLVQIPLVAVTSSRLTYNSSTYFSKIL